MRGLLVLLLAVASVVGLLWAGHFGWGPVVVTNEHEYKLILTLGNPARDPIVEPGIQIRIPFVDTVITLDKRLQYLDAKPVELLIGNETLIVDYYAVWKITDPLAFRRSYRGGMEDASLAIQRRLKSIVGATIGRLPLEDLLARGRVLAEMPEDISVPLAEKGIKVVDIRISRTELPREAEVAAYQQMREQRRAISREHRAMGDREAREIRAKAEREARTTAGPGELSAPRSPAVKATPRPRRIYASVVLGQDPEFYRIRTQPPGLSRHASTIDTTLVLSPGARVLPVPGAGQGPDGTAEAECAGRSARVRSAPVSTPGD